MSTDAAPPAEPEPGFEDALRRLEKTVQALESGDLGLDDALTRYEQGVRLVARCRTLLDGAERKVALLTGVTPDGEPQTSPFDASATVEREPAASPAAPRTRSVRSPKPPVDPNDDDAPF